MSDLATDFQKLILDGTKILFDPEDWPLIRKYKWHITKEGYIRTSNKNKILMHRLLMGLKKEDKLTVDHVNGLRHDNRRSNLRICQLRDNAKNRFKNRNNTSGFKGVSWHKRIEKWGAYIHHEGKLRSLGYFKTAEDAAKAYDRAAIKNYKQFAKVNFT